MGKRYMFAEDRDGHAYEINADQVHLRAQKQNLEAAGFRVSILDEDERIAYGLLAQQLRDAG